MVRTQKSMSVGSGNIGPNYIVSIPAGFQDPGIGILPIPNPGIEKSTPGLQSLLTAHGMLVHFYFYK